MNMPLTILPDDYGIRPAGEPDECFYCHRKVGEEHKPDCVIVVRKVRLRFAFDVVEEVPAAWDAEMIRVRYAQSTWCADNAVDILQRVMAEQGESGSCLCPLFSSEYLGETDGIAYVEQGYVIPATEEAQEDEDRWRSVAEELPHHECNVIVQCEDVDWTIPAYLRPGPGHRWVNLQTHADLEHEVTHWRPMPKKRKFK